MEPTLLFKTETPASSPQGQLLPNAVLNVPDVLPGTGIR